MKIEKTMGEMLAEFRAENGEEDAGDMNSAGSESKETETGEAIKESENLTESEQEEIDAEWLELISGMYV